MGLICDNTPRGKTREGEFHHVMPRNGTGPQVIVRHHVREEISEKKTACKKITVSINKSLQNKLWVGVRENRTCNKMNHVENVT